MNADTPSVVFWQKFDSLPFVGGLPDRITPQLSVPRLTAHLEDESSRIREQQITYQELLLYTEQKAVALVGPQGSGKTTLMSECVRDLARRLGCLPLFIPLGGLHDLDIAGFVTECLPPGNGADILASSKCVIAWDGLNELTGADTDDLGPTLLKFQSQYPQHYYLISTRLTDMPRWLGRDFLEVQVLPLPRDAVQQRLRQHFDRIVGASPPTYSSAGFNDLVALCQLPMIYSMVLSRLQGPNVDHATLVDLCAQRQKYSLYGDFLKSLISNSALEAALRPYIGECILSHLAYEMEIKHFVFAPEDWIETTLRDIITSPSFGKRFPEVPVQSLGLIISAILKSPPLQAIHYSQIGRLKFGFLHQSFAEYYAGRYIEESLRTRHLSDSDSLADLDRLLDDRSRRDWEVVRFAAASLEGDSRFVEYLATYAVRRRRQDLLVVAAQCLPLIKNATTLLTADLQIRMLDAFKNWEKPFDYDLLHELGELESQNGNDYRIACAQSQIRRYVSLYCPSRPVRLRFWFQKELEQLALSSNDEDAVNAIYTLGTFEAASANSITEFIMKNYAQFSQAAQEQALATLKELTPAASAPFFMKIIRDPSATIRGKVIALNGIGVSGRLIYVNDLIDYYTNPLNPHRDSAGWSLQMLGRVAQDGGQMAVLEAIKRTFWFAIEHEPDVGEGEYIKASVFYSFGIFKAREFIDRMRAWADKKAENKEVVPPLILEDLIFGLALMADTNDKRSAKFVSEYLAHSDPMVRLKAVMAVGLYRYKEAAPAIRELRNDEFKVVRDMARETWRKLR